MLEMSLQVEGLVTGYTDVNILHGVTLDAQLGKVTSIIGPNGAGKSTLLKAIYGFLRIKAGSVVHDGQDITGLSPDRMLSRGIAYIPQEISIFPYMTVKENLMLGAWVQRNNGQAVEEAIFEVTGLFPFLRERLNTKAGDLSGGQQKMLEIARGLMIKPRLLFVDEPSFGLSPIAVSEVYAKLRELNQKMGITVLLVDQNVKRAVDLANYVYVLELGTKKAEGSHEEFKANLWEIVKDWLQL